MRKMIVWSMFVVGVLAAAAGADDKELIAKLEVANRELQAQNALLQKQVEKLKAEIEELKTKVSGEAAPAGQTPGDGTTAAEPKAPTTRPTKLMMLSELKEGGSESAPTLKPIPSVGQSGRLPRGFLVVKVLDESSMLITANLLSAPRPSGSGGRPGSFIPATSKRFTFVLKGVATEGVAKDMYVKTLRLFKVTGTRKATAPDKSQSDILELTPLRQ